MRKTKPDKTFTKESISKVYFTQEADVSSKLIFGNHTLCAQFLRDYADPPIFPIVYYEGTGQWTAAKHLSERILMGDLFQKYIPDFEYKLVKIHDYTNRELLDYQDAISVLMLINKIQRAEDFEAFEDISAEEINRIYKKSPKDVEEILVEMVYALCRKINLSDRETEKYIKEARGGNMGYLWENMEKMDIQQERRNTANALKRADEVTKQRDDTFRILVQVYQKQGKTKEETVDLIDQESQLEKAVITEAVNRYWKKDN